MYESVAECLNLIDDLSTQELAHIVSLMAAQVPHAAPALQASFAGADARIKDERGEGLERIKSGYAPGTTPPAASNTRVTFGATPDADEIIPVVQMKAVSGSDRLFAVDTYNTTILCKFHEQMLPREEDFIQSGSSVMVLNLAYGHINGKCCVKIYSKGHSTVSLSGDFNVESFIPIRVELI